MARTRTTTTAPPAAPAGQDSEALEPVVVPFPEDVAAVTAHPWPRPMRASDVAEMIAGARRGLHPAAAKVSVESTQLRLDELVAATVLVKRPAKWWRGQGYNQLLPAGTFGPETAFYARPQDIPDWSDRLGLTLHVTPIAAAPPPPTPSQEESMQTTTFDNELGLGPIHFIHHGDFSGDVEISLPRTAVKEPESPQPPGAPDHLLVTVPFAALKAIVAAKVRGDAERRLENMDDDEVLGLLPGC